MQFCGSWELFRARLQTIRPQTKTNIFNLPCRGVLINLFLFQKQNHTVASVSITETKVVWARSSLSISLFVLDIFDISSLAVETFGLECIFIFVDL